MNLLRATSFRAALAFTLVLVVALGLVLGFVFQRFAAQVTLMQERQIWREAASLSQIYSKDGPRALAAAVTMNAASGQGAVLRLSNRLGVFIAGNLPNLPPPSATRQAQGWVHFEEGGRPVRGRLIKLDDDVLLLVGYDQSDAKKLTAAMRNSLLGAVLGLTLLGLGGGLMLARRTQARVAALNEQLQPVMQGALDRRLATAGQDEWSQMALHINTMLARLEQLMTATKQVSDNLAHDLRAPLTRLKMRLERLAGKSDSRTRDELGEALGDIDRLLHSFAALLTLSRLDSGVVRLARQRVNITALVTDVHELFEAVFAEADMRLVLDAQTVTDFTGDAHLLQQALTNLLENALAHAGVAGSMVTLSLHDDGAMVRLALADSGPGIASARRDEAMQRFVRLDASRAGDGSGLGLTLAAAIAAHHGGSLDLADNAPGLLASLHLPKVG